MHARLAVTLVALAAVVSMPHGARAEGGGAAMLQISPDYTSVRVSETVAFTATALDASYHVVSVTISWSVSGGGTISNTGVFTAGTVPSYAEVTATAGNLYASATVWVEPGPPVSLRIEPPSATLPAHAGFAFVAVGIDRFGNTGYPSGAWSVDTTAGSITSTGYFTAATSVGYFPGAVRFSANALTATANITVSAGAPASVTISPAQVMLRPGAHQHFTVSARDADGNPSAITPNWTLATGDAGTIKSNGDFTASGKLGSYDDVVIVSVGSKRATASVLIIAPASMRIVIAPANPIVTMGTSVDFKAYLFDTDNLELSGAPIAWSLLNGGGTLDESGHFTAGLEAGSFLHTVQAAAGAAIAATNVYVPIDSDQDGLPDYVEAGGGCGFDPTDPSDAAGDMDGDGMSNIDEARMGTCPCDPDVDDDGLPDGKEPKPGVDSDGDGLINVRDPDSDNDGLPDGLEMGYRKPTFGTDVDAGFFIPDEGPRSITDPLKRDTDGDGYLDGEEDSNHNGRVDPGETDPNVPDCKPACAADETCNRATLVCEQNGGGGDGGCGCASASAPPAALLGMALALGLRRRRAARRA